MLVPAISLKCGDIFRFRNYQFTTIANVHNEVSTITTVVTHVRGKVEKAYALKLSKAYKVALVGRLGLMKLEVLTMTEDELKDIEPSYRQVQGKPTTATDPTRSVWYSTNCSYWTDDWNLVSLAGPGIPVCPHCQAPGFIATYADWMGSARACEPNYPRYAEFLASHKGVCQPTNLGGTAALYEAFMRNSNAANTETNPRREGKDEASSQGRGEVYGEGASGSGDPAS